jgi:hypothetical protein
MATVSELDEQICLLDAEITQHARELRIRRNAMTPLGRIPPDVLADILHLLVRAEHVAPDAAHTFDFPFGERTEWTRVTRVCRYIRDVALGAPWLWAYIDLKRNPAWVDLCIARSRSSPVAVNIHKELLSTNEAHVLPLLARAHDARIAYSQKTRDVFSMARMLAEPLPLLRSLMYVPEWKQVDPFGVDLLGGATGALTTLVLRNVHLAEGLAFPALTRLKFKGVIDCKHPERLLRMIDRCSRLQHLRLRDVAFGKLDAQTAQISCPELLTLHARDTVSSLATLVRVLPIPQEECSLHASRAVRGESERVLRDQIWNHVMHFTGVDIRTATVPLVTIETRVAGSASDQLVLTLDTLAFARPHAKLVVFSPFSIDMVGILRGVRALRLRRNSWEHVFSANDRNAFLTHVEHLVFEELNGSLADLPARLTACINTLGMRIKTAHFKNYKWTPSRQWDWSRMLEGQVDEVVDDVYKGRVVCVATGWVRQSCLGEGSSGKE